MKEKLFLMTALLMAANCLSWGQQKDKVESSNQDYYCIVTYPDVQAFQYSTLLDNWQYLFYDWDHASFLWYNEDINQIYLAKHEKEGFQIYFAALTQDFDLRLTIDSYSDVNGNELSCSIYKEVFFTVAGLNGAYADALVPYNGETVHVEQGKNFVFYVELESAPNQPAGDYASCYTLYSGNNNVLQTHSLTATVWNFALPEAHYGTTIAGLYNASSSYTVTRGFLEKSGIHFDGEGEVIASDKVEAERILEGWQQFLLSHGVTTYEIPRFMIDDAPKEAELWMADTRRKAISIPLFKNNNKDGVTSYGINKINQYKDLVYDNPFLNEKAFFYVADEVGWNNDNAAAAYTSLTNQLNNLWPNYHAVVPLNSYSAYSYQIQKVRNTSDILCLNQGLLAGGYGNRDETMFNDFTDGSWHRTWRYLTHDDYGCLAVVRWSKILMGSMTKAVYWQQEAFGSSGILNWNIGYIPYVDNNPYDIWETHEIYGRVGHANVNGEGIFVYESNSLGFDPATPIASLRLKHINDGMDDYDYLQLAKEAFGAGEGSPYSQAMNTVFTYCLSQGPKYSFSCEVSPWDIGIEHTHNYEWNANGLNFINARILLGNALSEAMAGQHSWGEWQTAVLPDETHNGLEIRCCQDCGTQESRPMSYASLYRFVGTEDNQWTNLNNWANNPEILPSSGESVVIASDCEINDNTEVYYVVVNDGFNLTINEGATFTSQRITTEGDAQVIIEDGAQLYTMSEGVQAKVKKSITTQGDTDRWHFISTSLASAVVPGESNGLLSSTEDNFDLYWFNQGDNLEWRNYKSDSFSLENGIGYLYANSEENASLVFTGTTNGSISKEFGLDYDANVYLAGWNLVGNPYPCEVYANTSYYTLNDDGSAIEPNPVSSTVAIPACTGIMVKAEAEGESVVFSKITPETAVNNGILQIALNLSLSESVDRNGVSTGSTSLIDKVIVSFNQGDELGKFVFSKDNVKLYIPKDNEDYAIACVDKQGELPLNFEAKENGNYTISVTPESVKMNYLHLIDNITGEDIDLLVTPDYSFEANVIDNPSRFRLVFSAD